MKKMQILFPVLFGVGLFTQCKPPYSSTTLSDTNWPEARILRVEASDHSWPQGSNDPHPPHFAIIAKSADGKHNVVFAVLFHTLSVKQKYFGVNFGWTDGEISPENLGLAPDSFLFVHNIPGGEQFRAYINFIPTEKGPCANPYFHDGPHDLLVKTVLEMGDQLENHFQMYPNNEQPIPMELRKKIENVWKDMFSFPAELRSIPPGGC